VAFKAIQTYSNGDIVRWIDLPQPGQPAPAHPAPVVTLTAGAANAGATTAGVRTAPAGSGTDSLSRTLAVASLVVGVLAILLALTAGRWARRLAAGVGAPVAPVPANKRTGAANEQASDRVLAGTKASGRRDQPAAGSKSSARRPEHASAKASGRQSQSRRRG
jgi:hypothetical protein